MGVTQATKKKLFAVSGNECAFPECNEEVVDIEEETVIGEIAHIRARSLDGPRYDPDMTEDERDEFSNLMVLCPTHHKRIDKNPENYPPEKLKEWKAEHEKATKTDEIPEKLLTEVEGEGVDPVNELEEWTAENVDIWKERVEEDYGSVGKSPYEHGHWSFSYKVVDDFEEPSLSDLRELLQSVKGNETGWPAWLGANQHAKPYDGAVETWITDHRGGDPPYFDFWRAKPNGNLFLLRDYKEDHHEEYEPGKVFDLVYPIWRVGECLLHAKRLTRQLCDDSASVAINIRWTKIDGRRLVSITHRDGVDLFKDHRAHQESVSVSDMCSVSEIDEKLPEVVEELTKPLYQAFDFYEPPSNLIQGQLDRMQGR